MSYPHNWLRIETEYQKKCEYEEEKLFSPLGDVVHLSTIPIIK